MNYNLPLWIIKLVRKIKGLFKPQRKLTATWTFESIKELRKIYGIQ